MPSHAVKKCVTSPSFRRGDIPTPVQLSKAIEENKQKCIIKTGENKSCWSSGDFREKVSDLIVTKKDQKYGSQGGTAISCKSC